MEDVNLLLSFIVNEVESGKKTIRGGVVVNGDNIINLVNRIRIAVSSMNGEEQLREANERAKKIVALAEQTRSQLLDESDVMRQAQAEATRILSDAQRRKEAVETQVKNNVAEMLFSVRNSLLNAQKSVEESLIRLKNGNKQ
ncbi:MAG: hypothetical protein IJ735_00720 [Clostridia bacterium]|nr:hypothetical protein [Clostridia bacterium]